MTNHAANLVSRRQVLRMATAMCASAAWACEQPQRSSIASRERRDLYPEGVASGDPDASSVLLWTRRPFPSGVRSRVVVEVSEDESFRRVVATAVATVDAASDWTCRVLVGNLQPSHVYSYRFVDEQGCASRVGRTVTAPAPNDDRPVRFAFVSCQNANLGAQHAYRRMIVEDERAVEADRLGFVLHLGDFIYETVWYPEDNPNGVWGRRAQSIVRFPDGERIDNFHVPTTVDEYRALYRAYLHDPDLQDARARWPFVAMWDNHEFSDRGWQSVQRVDGKNRPAQTRKIAANQAWFEYQPARIRKSSGPSLDRFDPPHVVDAAVDVFDDHGLAQEPNNLRAVRSLTTYRSLRWGRHVELILTDQRSYRSEAPTDRPEAKALTSTDFPQMLPQEVLELLDAGRAYAGGNPPATIRFGELEVPNFRRNDPPQTILGAEQKRWFLQRLRSSEATWKVWGNSRGTLEGRIDPQNLPVGLIRPWPGAGYAGLASGGDPSSAYLERAEIYAVVRDENITGFATVSGDRHSFWAGLAAATLPPRPFEPVGVAFVTGSISTPGLVEILEHELPREHPLCGLYLSRRDANAQPEPVINMLIRRGVRSAHEYQQTGDVERARRLSNPELSPHLAFLDLGGHGYATVRASREALECEFVCIPRPIERVADADSVPVLYRVVHRTPLWKPGEPPRLEQRVLEGQPVLSL